MASTRCFLTTLLLITYWKIFIVLALEDSFETFGFTEITKKKLAKYNSDVDLNTFQLITKYGYPAESHGVKTEDGYLLTLHRIPHGLSTSNSIRESDKPVVFLQHGLFSSSADWVIAGPNKSLAYILADRGYDVWLGNIRGSEYSKSHAYLSTNDRLFWEFSFDEMGYYDLPAMIDFVLNMTGQTKLSYIGHSMGTTMFYAMASSKPEYNDKIQVMVSLAPLVYLSHTRSIVKYSKYLVHYLQLAGTVAGTGEFFPSSDFKKLLSRLFCEKYNIQKHQCKNILFLVTGFDNEQFNMTLYPLILSHASGSASLRTILHYIQIYETGKFQPYNCNSSIWSVTDWLVKKCYSLPPVNSYNLSQVTAPVTLHYGENDWVVDIRDLDKLRNELGNVIGLYRIPLESFNHIDFLYATDAPTLVYDRVLQVLKKANKMAFKPRKMKNSKTKGSIKIEDISGEDVDDLYKTKA